MKRKTLAVLALLLCCSGLIVAQTRLGHLRSWAGKYPTERKGKATKRFFLLPEIQTPLSKLLSRKDLRLLTREYEVESPIKQVGDYLVARVCRQHNCDSEQAGFVINLSNGYIYVRMYEDGKVRWFSSKGKYTDLPQDVQAYLNDFSAN